MFMAKQGRHLSEDETRKIIRLLETTDMTTVEIAMRMNRSPGTVNSVNRRYRIRDYSGGKSRWASRPKKMS
jgi:IS30 family transposase